jgi:hypothetical protein
MTPRERANGAGASRLSGAAIVVVGAATGIGGVPDNPIRIDPGADLAPLVAFRAGFEARTLTAQTVMLDGALWWRRRRPPPRCTARKRRS